MSERVGATVSGSGLRTGLVCGRQMESEVCGHPEIRLPTNANVLGASSFAVSCAVVLFSRYPLIPLRSNSNDTRELLVPRTHNKLGDKSFSAAGPRL